MKIYWRSMFRLPYHLTGASGNAISLVEKCFFALARLFRKVFSLFLYLFLPRNFYSCEIFSRAKYFREILRKNAKKFRTNDHSCEILCTFKGDNWYLFLITTAPFLTRATKKTFSKQWNFITGCSCNTTPEVHVDFDDIVLVAGFRVLLNVLLSFNIST